MKNLYSIGLDFGTNSIRALLLDLKKGKEVGSFSADYPSGENGILHDQSNPHLARQNTEDYLLSMTEAVNKLLKGAESLNITKENIIGIGTTATGSTPLPVDKNLTAIGLKDEFNNNLNAQAWLWKDHTSAEEAEEITQLARKIRPQYLRKCGGAYSSEWFFSKIFYCLRNDTEVFNAAYSWIELSDYIPAVLCGIDDVHKVKRNICAAGHKAMYNKEWGGLPDKEFLNELSPELGKLRDRLYEETFSIEDSAGTLSKEWADKLNLTEGIPVAIGQIDAHTGAIGSGVGEGVFVKIIGTSTCDIMVHPMNKKLKDIPGVAGIVPESVLPGYIGIEAGQSAVGDIFNWFVSKVLNKDENYHSSLTEKAAKLKAGQSGLLALDWNNGNRNILTDANLTGLILGQTLHTTDYEIYRALIEATAFGALRIIDQIESYGIQIDKVINCGGIAHKNPLFMKIYANVFNRPMEIAESAQTVALGAAIIGGYVALKGEQGFESIEKIQKKVCKVKDEKYLPKEEEVKTYKKLYELYKKLHDSFGATGSEIELFPVMKKLIQIKKEVTV